MRRDQAAWDRLGRRGDRLQYGGSDQAGIGVDEIGERLLRQVPDVTRLLDRMTEMKLIGRQRSDADRRLVQTRITAKGLELLAELDRPVRAFHRTRLAGIGAARLRQLVDTLADIRGAQP